MECRSCLTTFFDQDKWERITIPGPGSTASNWDLFTIVCPSCRNPTISLASTEGLPVRPGRHHARVIYPRSARRKIEPAVPVDLRRDYHEACEVLPISAKASAALSRRVLQEMLREQGYDQGKLIGQIKAVLAEQDPEKILSPTNRHVVDAIRNFGNFAAHVKRDVTSSEMIDVEPWEAEWCLEIIEGLFDEYYVKPDASEKKLQELNDKLAQAGERPARS